MLPPLLGMPTLVVAAKEEDRLLPMEVDEDSKQHLLPGSLDIGKLPTEHPGDLVGVVPDPELMKPATERLEPFGTNEIHSSDREHTVDCRVQSDELEVGKVVDETLEGHGAVVSLEGLRVPDTGHSV